MNRHLGFSQFKYRAILRSLLEGRVQLARRPATVDTVDIRTPRAARFFGIPARVAIPRQALPTWPGNRHGEVLLPTRSVPCIMRLCWLTPRRTRT